MYRLQKIALISTLIVVCLCWLFVVDAQSSCEREPTEEKNVEQNEKEEENTKGSESYSEGENTAKKKKEQKEKEEKDTNKSEDNLKDEKPIEESKKASEDGREIDLFIGGDDNLQSFNFMIELPFDEEPFKFEKFEGFLSGKSFMTFRKPVDFEETSAWVRLWKEYSGMKFASRSYTLRAEGSPLVENKLRHLGGYIEFESDYSVDIDPNLHFTGYVELPRFTVYGVLVEAAVGGWGEVRRVGKSTRWVEKVTKKEGGIEKEIEIEREVDRLRGGLRGQLDFKHNTERTHFCMEVEWLQSFDEYHVNISPEFELKFNLFKKDFGLVLHLEIGYYSKEEDFKIEPLTQLIRYSF